MLTIMNDMAVLYHGGGGKNGCILFVESHLEYTYRNRSFILAFCDATLHFVASICVFHSTRSFSVIAGGTVTLRLVITLSSALRQTYTLGFL